MPGAEAPCLLLAGRYAWPPWHTAHISTLCKPPFRSHSLLSRNKPGGYHTAPAGTQPSPWGPLPNLPEPQRPNWPQHLANLAVQASRHRVAPFAGPSLSKAQDGPLPKGPDQPLSSRTLQYAQTPLPKPFCEPRDLKKHTLQVTFFVRRMEDPRPLSGQTRHLPRLDRCLKSWQECCQHMQSWLLRTALFPVPDTCSKDLNVSNPQKENPLEDRLHTH